jgi:SAM-dependent methyltransferase
MEITDHNPSLYDQNDYYDASGSRLAPFLDPVLDGLDKFKANRVVKKTGLKPGKALDVGAGDGKFLYFLAKQGWKVFGTTASRTSGQAAVRKYGVHLEVTKDIPLTLSERHYDLITYWHVFEHLENPQSHAEVWPQILNDRGQMVIEVPNIESFGAKFCYASWLGSDDKHHINHQTRDQIATLLERNGLEIRRTEGFSLKFSFVFLWSALLGMLFGKRYHFDRLMDLLKYPVASLKARPFSSLNAIAALGYLAPLIVLLTAVGCLIGRGEVLRLYAAKRT